MIAGNRFRLVTSTTAVDTVDGKQVAVIVPAGATLKPVPGPSHEDGMVNLFWDGRVIMMFAVDVEERAVALENFDAGKSPAT